MEPIENPEKKITEDTLAGTEAAPAPVDNGEPVPASDVPGPPEETGEPVPESDVPAPPEDVEAPAPASDVPAPPEGTEAQSSASDVPGTPHEAGQQVPTADVSAPQEETGEPVPESDVPAPPEDVEAPAPASDVPAPPEGMEEPAPESDVPAPDEEGAGEANRESTLELVASGQLFLAESNQTASETEDAQLKAMLEAIIYVTEEPLSILQFANALGEPRDRIEAALAELVAEYDRPERGLTIREVAGGYKMATKPEHHEAVRTFVKKLKPPLKLSLAALETLAVIAYKQPVTAPEIMEIRGVQGAGVLKTLLDRKLIAAAGRKNVIGKPILYKTTKDFLVQFGLKDLNELPSLKEFEELRRLAVNDMEPPAETAAQTDAEEQTAGEGVEPERNAEAGSAAVPVEPGAPAPASSNPEPAQAPSDSEGGATGEPPESETAV